MSRAWNALSILLIILTPITYLHQVRRLLAMGASPGISITATFLNTLVAQGQTANMYYLFKTAPLMREGVPIATPPAIRDWLNMGQIFVQWWCSVFYYTLIVCLPTIPVNSNSSGAGGSTGNIKIITATFLVIHNLIFLLLIPVGGRRIDPIFNIIRNVNAAIANPILTLCAVAAFIIQAQATWHVPQESSNALSKTTLVYQVALFSLLAISWPFRMILPRSMWQSKNQPAILTGWYPWVGWACVNNAVFGFGQAVVLLVAWQGRGGSSPLSGERQHLLAT